jgi:SAM-dependent methyltransferase
MDCILLPDTAMTLADRRKWDARYTDRSRRPLEPEPWLVRHTCALRPGEVLDVASGDGRNALHLARHGFRVTALDVSPVGLARLADRAQAEGVEGLTTVAADLDDPAALEGLGSFDDLVVVKYKPSPAQWRMLIERLRPDGILLLCSFGKERARSGFDPAFCLDQGELEEILGADLRRLLYERLGPEQAWLEGSLWRRDSGPCAPS